MNAVPAGPFPHVYRPTRWARCASFNIGGAIIVGAMIAFYLVWASDDPCLPTLRRKLLASTFCAAGAAIGVL